MWRKYLKMVSLLSMIIIVTPSFSSTVFEQVDVDESDSTSSLGSQEIGTPQGNNENATSFSYEFDESTKSDGSSNPAIGSNEREVLWDTINLREEDYDVYTYWDSYPSPRPSSSTHYYISPVSDHVDFGANLLRVAIYKGPISEDTYVQDKNLQEEIITAMEIKGHGAYETEVSDYIDYVHYEWAKNKRDDLVLAGLDFIDNLFFGADEEKNERQIITLFLVKALDVEGCSPLSGESYYEASEWYEDLLGFLGNIAPGKLELLVEVIDKAISYYGSITDYAEFIMDIDDGTHCDLALEVLYETFNLLNDLIEFDQALEITLEGINAIIRGVWEIKIVEKYKNELNIIYNNLPNHISLFTGDEYEGPVKKTINDLINEPTSHLIENFKDAIIGGIVAYGFDITGSLIATAAMSNPITAAIYIGLGIGLFLAKYLVANWDVIRGHSYVALILNSVEQDVRIGLNGGSNSYFYTDTYGLMNVVQDNPTAENLAAYNLAQKIQLNAGAAFYLELKEAVSGIDTIARSESERENLHEVMDSYQGGHDYYTLNAYYKVPWVSSSNNDIIQLLGLTRPIPNIHVDPSGITLDPQIPQIGKTFSVEMLIENTGDVDIDSVTVSLLVANKVSRYRWEYISLTNEIAGAFGFDCDSFMEILQNLENLPIPQIPVVIGGGSGDDCTIRVLRKDNLLLGTRTIHNGIDAGEEAQIKFHYINVYDGEYAGYNNLEVRLQFTSGNSKYWDSVVKPIKINRPPNVPSLISPVNYSGESPTFKFATGDPDGDNLQYSLELRSKWGSFSETWSLPGPYNSGETVTFNYPYSLSDDDYYWWVEAYDGMVWQSSVEDDFEVDTTAPITFHSGHKIEEIQWWSNDWYKGNISLEASDLGSGVDYTNYSLDGGVTWIQTFDTQTSPVVVIDTDGIYDLQYYSVDKAGIKESNHIYDDTKVDMTDPTLNATNNYDPSLGTDEWVDYNVSFTLAPEDVLVNGVASGVGYLHYWIFRNHRTYSDYVEYNYSSPVSFTLSEDGLYYIFYTIMDYAYNWNHSEFTVKIDKNPPNSTIHGPDGEHDWFKRNPAIYSEDEGSGIYSLQYRIVGERYIEGDEYTDDDDYSESIDITDTIIVDRRATRIFLPIEDGWYNITYHAEDNIGRVEPEKTTEVKVDSNKPITMYEISEEPDFNGWYNTLHSNLTIYLNATDNGPSGFWHNDVCITSIIGDHLDTCIASINANSTYNISWSEHMDWIGRVTYHSTDMAGNVEDLHYKVIKVDMTPPSTSAEILEIHNYDPEDSWVGVSFFSEDFTSGVSHIKYKIVEEGSNGGEWLVMVNWKEYNPHKVNFTIYLLDNKMYTIHYYAVDFANNVEPTRTIYLLPDLRILYGDIWMEGGNLYVEVENIGYVDAHDVPIHLYGVITTPGSHLTIGEYYLNSTTIAEVRAKKSAVACFLPREYLGFYNEIKVVIELDNATLPEYDKDNNEASKFIIVIAYEWIIREIEEITNSIVIVPKHICKPVRLVENGKLTFAYSDMVFIEPCPYEVGWPPDIISRGERPGIQVDTSGVLELVESTISAINNVRKIIMNIDGDLVLTGANLIRDAIVKVKDQVIPPPETWAIQRPAPLPSLDQIIDNLLNAQPAPLPSLTGKSIDVEPVLGEPYWTINPAIPLPQDIEVMVEKESSLKLINSELAMKPSNEDLPTLTVHKGSKLYLIDTKVAISMDTGVIGLDGPLHRDLERSQGPPQTSSKFKLLGGGEIVEVNSEILDYVTYGVQLETSSFSNYVALGNVVTYNLIVTNSGNDIDTFDLSVTTQPGSPSQSGFDLVYRLDKNWKVWLSVSQVTVLPKQSVEVTIYAKAPSSLPDS